MEILSSAWLGCSGFYESDDYGDYRQIPRRTSYKRMPHRLSLGVSARVYALNVVTISASYLRRQNHVMNVQTLPHLGLCFVNIQLVQWVMG